MNNEAVMKYIKAVAGILACAGIVVSPEQMESISAGFLAIYSVLSVIQGKIKSKKDGPATG